MSMCTISNTVSTLTGGIGRTLIWSGCSAYGLKNFLAGAHSVGRVPFSNALINLAITAIGLPMAIEGLHSFATAHKHTECSNPSTQKVAQQFFN